MLKDQQLSHRITQDQILSFQLAPQRLIEIKYQ